MEQLNMDIDKVHCQAFFETRLKDSYRCLCFYLHFQAFVDALFRDSYLLLRLSKGSFKPCVMLV